MKLLGKIRDWYQWVHAKCDNETKWFGEVIQCQKHNHKDPQHQSITPMCTIRWETGRSPHILQWRPEYELQETEQEKHHDNTR